LLGLAAVGLAAGAFYAGAYPYGYGFDPYAYYDGCGTVARRVFDGWGYRVVYVNTCDYAY